MIRVSLVVAVSENHVIGKDNQLLWSLPNDMKFFKNTTWGMPVIMGRKTFESLGKPLPGRTNIVITSKPDWQAPGTITVSSLDEAIHAAEETDAKEVFVIGGGQVYKQSMPVANRIYYTRVHTSVEGDTFFPEIDRVQ
ncbi:MAG TPA: dihydrofolate reductase, partial [Flavitalea sp.]|nr:dihydrofolate reductase [Flavitalea sp.]